MNELYEELETPECERKVSRIAKAKDFTKNNPIKEEHRVLRRDLDRIVRRWKGYFNKLLNGENHRFDPDGVPNLGLKRPCIEFGVVRIDSAIVVCIHSAIIQLLLTRRVSYCYPAG